MKNLSVFTNFIVIFFVSVVSVRSQTAEIIKRPAYIDISAAESRSAVLVRLSGYSSNDVRYRLYNGSYQYNCWNLASGTYVTSTAYTNGPQVPGEPVSVTRFWILFERGNNNSVIATYRDRLGTEYKTNYQTAALPSATEIISPYILSGKLDEGAGFPLTVKYVILAWNGETLISASHSDPGTGNFSIIFPSGVTINKVEVRTISDEPAGVKNGTWESDCNIDKIALGILTEIHNLIENTIKIYPVPAGDVINFEGIDTYTLIEIFDLTGYLIFSIPDNGSKSLKLNVSGLHSGIYFVKLNSPEGYITRKIIVR